MKVKESEELKKVKINSKSTLFLKWDNTYVNQKLPKTKEYGVYKVHGHKFELQMVNYGEVPGFKFYKFIVNKNKLTLISVKEDEELQYSRVYQFLQ